MNTLFYELMYSKKTKRQIQMLSIIESYSGPILFSELQAMLNVTNKTLLSDLLLLRETLPTGYELIERERLISIDCADGKSLQDYIHHLAMGSAIYQIMETILHNKVISIFDLEEKLSLSVSSIRKRILHYNKVLKPFHLELSSYNIELIGDEIDIRQFMFSFFTEFRQLVVLNPEAPLSGYHYLYAKMRTAMVENRYPLLNTSYFQVTQRLILAQIRTKNHQYVSLKNERLRECVLTSRYYPEFRKAFALTFDVSALPEDEFIWAFISSLDTVVYSTREKSLGMFRNDVVLYSNETVYYQLIHSVAASLGLLGDGDFLNIHFAYLRNLSLLTAMSPIYQLTAISIVDLAKTDFLPLFELWYNAIRDKQDNLPFAIEKLEDVCATLALLSSQFHYEQEAKLRKIICSFSGESGVTAFMEKQLQNIIEHDIEVIPIVNQRVTSSLVTRTSVDLVICNYSISDTAIKVPIYRLPYLPTDKDWHTLQKYLTRFP